MKNKKGKQGNGFTQAQRIALALAFVGEHKEQFEKWIKEKKESQNENNECI